MRPIIRGLWTVSIAFAMWTSTATAQRADLAIRAARLLDVGAGRYTGPSVVLVTGSRIVAVVPAERFDAQRAARTIDLGDLTLIPGPHRRTCPPGDRWARRRERARGSPRGIHHRLRSGRAYAPA